MRDYYEEILLIIQILVREQDINNNISIDQKQISIMFDHVSKAFLIR
jgi:hypothetical protein